MILKREIKSREKLQRLKNRLEKNVYTPVGKLDVEVWITREPANYNDKKRGRYVKLREGQKWGDLFDCAWFHFTGELKDELKDKNVYVLIDVSGEGLIVDKKGNPLRGMTSVTSRDEWPLGMWGKFAYQINEELIDDGKIDIWMDAGCNDIEGQYKNDGKLKQAELAVLNENIRTLYYDFASLISLYDAFVEEDNVEYKTILEVLENAARELKTLSDYNVLKAIDILSVLYLGKKSENEFTFSSIGHAHTDLIFLWPLRETIRKGARTYSTVMDLMDKYKNKYEYLFGCSQPQMYELIRENYPDLFEKIQRKIEEGKWECQGAMWVESDTNIPSGESLIRQILYGKKYFREMFGKEIDVCFLPDVFGYSAALPQILKKSGTKYFMTQKLNMNDTNVFPHHTFMWEGLDGSKVLTHMMPESTYNSPAVPQIVMYGRRNFKNKNVSNEAIQLFGIGDGGGGPGPEHIERLIRNEKLSYTPVIKPEFTQDFFKRIEKDTDKYPAWSGELYFEKHQGTYTSQAKSKYYNRKVEIALHECEFALSLCKILCDGEYPLKSLEKIWKEILLYQFHDVLPGSSIKRVYEETHARYKILLKEINEIRDEAYLIIASKINTSGFKNPYIVFNSMSFDREEYVNISNKCLKIKIPALGYTLFDLDTGKSEICTCNLNNKDNSIENDLIKVVFSENGNITSVFDKKRVKEVLKDNGNRLSIFNDENNNWDIDKRYLTSKPEYPELIKVSPYQEKGRCGFDFTYKYNESLINQNVSIKENSSRIDFETKVSWNETYKMLRTSFPINIVTDHAKCEIQFGHINRPTHRNTTWDEAKFEICAHKWVDMGDNGYGCALLNDCKYGYKIWDNILDLNLLRSQMCPEVDSDKGDHEFTYALFPHQGSVSEGKVIHEGYRLNYPVHTYKIINSTNELKNVYTLAKTDNKDIIIENVKLSEDGKGIILRMYESAGKESYTNIKFDGVSVKALVDLTENCIEEKSGQEINLKFTPFEIKSLLVEI